MTSSICTHVKSVETVVNLNCALVSARWQDWRICSPSSAVTKAVIWFPFFGWGRAETCVRQPLSVVVSTRSGLSSSSSRVAVLVAWYKQGITANDAHLFCGKHLDVASEWMCVWVNRCSTYQQLSKRALRSLSKSGLHLNTRGKKKKRRIDVSARLRCLLWLTERCDSEPLLMFRCGTELFGMNLGQAAQAGRATFTMNWPRERERERVISRVISVSAPSPSQHTRLVCVWVQFVCASTSRMCVCLCVCVFVCFALMISDSGRGGKYRSSHLTEPEESDGEGEKKRMRVLEDKKGERASEDLREAKREKVLVTDDSYVF